MQYERTKEPHNAVSKGTIKVLFIRHFQALLHMLP